VLNRLAIGIRNTLRHLQRHPRRLVITTTSLPPAVQNQPYDVTLSATGGTLPYTWSLAPGNTLPSDLSLSSLGVIMGTPKVVGTFTFVVQVQG